MSEISDLVAQSPTTTIRYDAMCRAIQAAYHIDEVKHIRDKAKAIEEYAKQARNYEAEQQAREIRLRAERRTGQLLAERQMAKGAPGNQYTGPLARHEGSKTLADLGISHDQSSRWQKLAAVPEDKFEQTLTAPGAKPTTGGIIAAHTEPKDSPTDPHAYWLWGRLEDFERQAPMSIDPNELIATMPPAMQVTTRVLASRLVAWLEKIRPIRGDRDDGLSETTTDP